MAEDEKETPKEEPGEGEKTPSSEDTQRKGDRIQEARAVADRIDEGVKRFEELTTRNEKVLEEQIISGRADAGSQPVKKVGITDEDYAKKALSGELNDNIQKKE